MEEFISSISPCAMNRTDCGWYLDEGQFAAKWYDGSQVPEAICHSLASVVAAAVMDDDLG